MSMEVNTSDSILIVGGGIFGLTTAIVLSDHGYNITVVEKDFDILLGATKCNQNRIHHGFHYPRSTQTSKESLMGLKTFMDFYGECINYKFDKYYAISAINSHVNTDQFVEFSRSMGLNMKEQWPDERILRRDNIESCWLTGEPVFDYSKLREMILERISSRKIKIIRNCSVSSLDGDIAILNNNYKIKFRYLINATYSGIPDFLKDVGCNPIKGKFQLCVLPIMRANCKVPNFGVTIMDGPFCSLMPRGFNDNSFILYHVIHSVNQEHVGTSREDWLPIKDMTEMNIVEQCRLYYPILEDMVLSDSWITTRMVLPEQEMDDARPTLVLKNSDSIFSLFSGKITTCVDAANKILKLIDEAKN
jgi:glycine/D-amino acid oxidase-like deaminating enzyme